ncbi:MAG: ATP-binding protein, partial [Bacteroidota bacterium]
PDKGLLHIKTRTLPNDFIEVTIRDTGKGIPKEAMDHIFEPFYTTKDVGEGTGLGLSISLGIIEQHQGTIQMESMVGHGTEVIIQLPQRLRSEEPTTPA